MTGACLQVSIQEVCKPSYMQSAMFTHMYVHETCVFCLYTSACTLINNYTCPIIISVTCGLQSSLQVNLCRLRLVSSVDEPCRHT